jgi:LmbE family N-acetylglucosaminyl deacetylase
MNIVVIAPHPDDESIGCGGTLRLHAQRGDRVAVVYLTSGELGLKKLPRERAWDVREAEARKAATILGLAEPVFLRCPDWVLDEHLEAAASALVSSLKAERPEMVYLPHPLEWHPDHKAALPILWSAIDESGVSPATVRGYEIWTPMPDFDHVESIDTVMPIKLRAIRAYRSQLEQLPYDRAIRGLNEYRGAIAGRCRFAEVFKLIRRDKSAS